MIDSKLIRSLIITALGSLAGSIMYDIWRAKRKT